jgi:hypothetical protein
VLRESRTGGLHRPFPFEGLRGRQYGEAQGNGVGCRRAMQRDPVIGRRGGSRPLVEMILQRAPVGTSQVEGALEQQLVAALALDDLLEAQALALQRIGGGAMLRPARPQVGLDGGAGALQLVDLGCPVGQGRRERGDVATLPGSFERVLA